MLLQVQKILMITNNRGFDSDEDIDLNSINSTETYNVVDADFKEV